MYLKILQLKIYFKITYLQEQFCDHLQIWEVTNEILFLCLITFILSLDLTAKVFIFQSYNLIQSTQTPKWASCRSRATPLSPQNKQWA